MSADSTGQSPFNRWWFVALGGVLLVVVALVLLLTGVIGSGGSASPQPTTTSTQQPDPGTSTNPAETSTPPNAEGCDVPAGDQSIPTTAPQTTWQTNVYFLYPTSTVSGPLPGSGSERWGCFARSPSGALFASANALVGLLGEDYQAFAGAAALPAGRDAWVASQSSVKHTQTAGRVAQLAGFQFLSVDNDQATVSLGLAQEDFAGTLKIAVRWDEESANWKIDLLATDLTPVRTPLDAYTPWSAANG